MSGDSDDDEMAKRAATGDRAAMEHLLDAYYERIHRMAWRWCGSADAAQDIAQDVCVKLATSISGFRSDAAFATWVWRITYNAAIDQLRAAQRFKATSPADMMTLTDQPSAHTPVVDAEARDLWSAVRTLPAQQRDAVLLVYAEDMSHAEAAGILSCSTKTVSWHLHEARKTLKIQLEAVE
jgi:RNA polymerase sigma-70 factor (ECF subfamily)